MQNETLQGIAPAAARGAIAHDVRLCVACLHENRGGEKSCEACGTSLFLILCGACEAANSAGDVRCHGCGAALGTESSDKPAEPAVAPPASEPSLGRTDASAKPEVEPPAVRMSSARTEAREEPEAEPPVGRMSLVRTEASDERAAAPPAKPMNRWRSALILAGVVVTTAGVTHHFSARTDKADRAPQGKVIEAAPVRSVEPPGRVVPPKTEPKAGGPSVTHTQPADASQTAPSAPVARAAVIEVAPVKSVEPPRRAPPPRTEPKVVTPAGGPPASVGSALPAGSAYSRVTHTRPADASPVAPSAAVAPPAPDAGQKSEAGCGGAVAALGLCNSGARSGGK